MLLVDRQTRYKEVGPSSAGVEVCCGLSMTEGRMELEIDRQTAAVMPVMNGKTKLI